MPGGLGSFSFLRGQRITVTGTVHYIILYIMLYAAARRYRRPQLPKELSMPPPPPGGGEQGQREGRQGRQHGTYEGPGACWVRLPTGRRDPAHRDRTAPLRPLLKAGALAPAPTKVERAGFSPRTIGGGSGRGEAPPSGAGRHQAVLRLLRREACGFARLRAKGQRRTVDWSRPLEGSAIAQGTPLPRGGPHKAEPGEKAGLPA